MTRRCSWVGGPSQRILTLGVAPALFMTLLVANLLPAVAATAAAPTLPTLTRFFAATPNVEQRIPLVLTLAALAVAVTGPLAGIAVDRLGRRAVLLAGVVLYALAGSSAVLATDLRTILIGRFLLGAAVACVLTAANTLVGDLLDGPARAWFLAVQTAIVGIVASAVIVLSGVLASINWRLPFLLYLFALSLVPMALRFLPGGVGPVRVALLERPSVPTLPSAIAAVSASVAPGYLPSARVHREIQGPRGSLAFVVVTVYLGVLLFQATYYLVAVQIPFVLEERFAAGPEIAGAMVALLMFSYAMGALASVRLSRAQSARATAAVSLFAVGIGYVGLGAGSAAVVGPAALVAGIGFGLINPNLLAWLAAIAPAHSRGRLFGWFTTSLFLGQFLSPFLWRYPIEQLGRSGAIVLAGGLSAAFAGILLLPIRRPARVSQLGGGIIITHSVPEASRAMAPAGPGPGPAESVPMTIARADAPSEGDAKPPPGA